MKKQADLGLLDHPALEITKQKEKWKNNTAQRKII
jgi:hypothetical protein